MAEFDFELVHRSGFVHGNPSVLSRCSGGEKNFPDDCTFRYDNGLVNEAEHVENSSKVDMLPLIFENDKIGITIQLHDSNSKITIYLLYLIGSDAVLEHHLKRLESPAKRFGIIGLALEK